MPGKPTAVESIEPAKRRGRPAGSKNKPRSVSTVVPIEHAPINVNVKEPLTIVDEQIISSYPGYIKGLRNSIFVVSDKTGKVMGDMITDDPSMLAHFKGVSQWAIHREFLSKDDMLKSIGKLGVVIVGGVKYNKVVIFNGERLE